MGMQVELEQVLENKEIKEDPAVALEVAIQRIENVSTGKSNT